MFRVAMIGATGFIGSHLLTAFRRVGMKVQPFSHLQAKAGQLNEFERELLAWRTDFLVNAAGFTGQPNVDACESAKAACLEGNAVLPGIVRRVCESAGIPFGHVSSGCIYTGTREDGRGFIESDTPNFSFRTQHCSFYSGSKALGEELLEGCETCYIWRLRVPFDEIDGPRNYLSKMIRYERLLDARNSLSHLGDFAESCVKCVTERLPFGTYNLTNPGSVTTRQVVELLKRSVAPDREFQFFESEQEFMRVAATAPRSNCVLDASKAIAHGLPMRPIDEALRDALENWQPETSHLSANP